MVSFEREIQDNLSSPSFPSMIFTIFNTESFMSVSPMMCSLPCFAIKYETFYDAVRIALSMGTLDNRQSSLFLESGSLYPEFRALCCSIFYIHAVLRSDPVVLPLLD